MSWSRLSRMTVVACIAASVATASEAGPGLRAMIRRALFSRLEANSRGMPEAMVELLVRVKTPHSHLSLAGEGPLAESLDVRRQAVASACRRVVSGIESCPLGPAAPGGPLFVPTLASPPVVLDTFWASRCVHVRIPASSVGALMARSDIDGIFENVHVQARPHGEVAGRTVAYRSNAPIYWGQQKIRSPLARSRFGVDGSGVVIGHIDTGVDGTHPALAGKVARFLDLVNGRRDPYDDDGHGTHTAGIMCGSDGMGVAPGARMVVAKALDRKGGGSLANLLKAMQWMIDPDGDPRTADQPSVVCNSWGVRSTDAEVEGFETTLFWETIRAWRSRGIVPVFAAGNTGPQSLLLPGSYPVNFSVTATDPKDDVASFACSGRADWIGWAFFKPDLCAPGVDVPSAAPGRQITWMSGTSMATPHVAGLMALSVQLDRSIPVRDREQLVMNGCLDLGPAGRGQRSGEGRIDAVRTLELSRAYRAPAQAATDYAPVFLRARRFQVKR